MATSTAGSKGTAYCSTSIAHRSRVRGRLPFVSMFTFGSRTKPPDLLIVAKLDICWSELAIQGRMPLGRNLWIPNSQTLTWAPLCSSAEGTACVLTPPRSAPNLGLPYVMSAFSCLTFPPGHIPAAITRIFRCVLTVERRMPLWDELRVSLSKHEALLRASCHSFKLY